MVNNFEELTEELTDYEKEVVLPLIVKGLKTKIGKEKAITNGRMQFGLENNSGIKITGPRVRKIIQYIRMTGKVERLMATSKGYYISNDIEELNGYVESLFQRADSIYALAKQLDFQIKNHKN